MSKVVVLLPCYNEAKTIAKVVNDFRRELPGADILVYDNNSTDHGGEIAAQAGADVRRCVQQGKGHVIRRMFCEVDADIYVMADSDDTYPANEVHKLIQPVADGLADMVNGDRLSSTYSKENKRPGHNFGNALVCGLIQLIWRKRVNDVMTGYRTFSRRFVKTCPILSNGFEVETEMTLHALDKRMSIVEIPIQYRDRPAGSVSKLRTIHDGFLVLRTIFNLFRFYRPLMFFGLLGFSLFIAAVCLAAPVFIEYFSTGKVPRYPSLIFACFMMTSAFLCAAVGLILDAVKKQSDREFELLKNFNATGVH